MERRLSRHKRRFVPEGTCTFNTGEPFLKGDKIHLLKTDEELENKLKNEGVSLPTSFKKFEQHVSAIRRKEELVASAMKDMYQALAVIAMYLGVTTFTLKNCELFITAEMDAGRVTLCKQDVPERIRNSKGLVKAVSTLVLDVKNPQKHSVKDKISSFIVNGTSNPLRVCDRQNISAFIELLPAAKILVEENLNNLYQNVKSEIAQLSASHEGPQEDGSQT